MAGKPRPKRKAKISRAPARKSPPAARDAIPDLSAAIPLGDAIDAYAIAVDRAEETAYRRTLYEKRNALEQAGLDTTRRALRLDARVKIIRWISSDLGGLVYMTSLCAETPGDPVFAQWRAENPSLDFAKWFAAQPADGMLGNPPNPAFLQGERLSVDMELEIDPPTSARCTHRLAAGLLRRLLSGESVAFARERDSPAIRRIEPREWRGDWQFAGDLSQASGGHPALQLANVKIIEAAAIETVRNPRGAGRNPSAEWPDIARKLKARIEAMKIAERPKSKAALIAIVRELHPAENLKDQTIRDNVIRQLGQLFWDEFQS